VGTIGENGFAFSLDLMIAFLALLLMLSLMLAQLDLLKGQAIESIEGIALQRKAIFLIDSMVKNRNEENPGLGSALFDAQKHRILQNELDPILLGRARAEIESGENCLSLDRIVLVNGKLEKAGVRVCEG